MRTVYKYELPNDQSSGGIARLTEFEMQIPVNADFLHLALQHDKACMWFLVDDEAERELRKFCIAGTGHAIPTDGDILHRGTYQRGWFVFHVFEVIRSTVPL